MPAASHRGLALLISSRGWSVQVLETGIMLPSWPPSLQTVGQPTTGDSPICPPAKEMLHVHVQSNGCVPHAHCRESPMPPRPCPEPFPGLPSACPEGRPPSDTRGGPSVVRVASPLGSPSAPRSSALGPGRGLEPPHEGGLSASGRGGSPAAAWHTRPPARVALAASPLSSSLFPKAREHDRGSAPRARAAAPSGPAQWRSGGRAAWAGRGSSSRRSSSGSAWPG